MPAPPLTAIITILMYRDSSRPMVREMTLKELEREENRPCTVTGRWRVLRWARVLSRSSPSRADYKERNTKSPG